MAWFKGNFRSNNIEGTDSNDWMFGWFGNDTMAGGGGDDIMLGGFGNDVMRGDGLGSFTDPGPNLITNGSFEDTTGLTPRGFGFVGDLPGWTSNTPGTPEIEVVTSGVVGMPAADGNYWIDTGSLADRVIDISQTVDGVEDGVAYDLTFQAGQWDPPSAAPDETMEVYWNGELIATIRPDAVDSYETFSFEVTGGSGDGTNTLRFVGVTDGTSDAQGVVLDDVSLTKVPVSNEGDDILSGGRGRDKLFGDGGDDTLIGGAHNDESTGGAGEDVFVFDYRDGTDTITDFTIGEDTIAVVSPWLRFTRDRDSTAEDHFNRLDIDQVGSDTEVSFGRTTVILEDTVATDLTVNDFVFI